MPFVAESIWQYLNEAAFERGLPNPEPAVESVVIAPWPAFPAAWKDPAMEQRIARMQELIRFVREVRNRYMLEPKTSLDVFVRCNETIAADFRMLAAFVVQLAGVRQLEAGPQLTKPPQAATHVLADFESYVSLQGLIDPAAERKRLEKQLGEKKKHLQSMQAKLGNESFRKNAPAEVVQQNVQQVADLENQIKTIEENLRELGPG
jgi:valyl-tRNA synthetase